MNQALNTVALCVIAALLGYIGDMLRHIRNELREQNEHRRYVSRVGHGR